MPGFYEIVLKVPSDLDEHLPGISDSFVNWVAEKEWELPPDSDMDLNLIEQAPLTVAEKLQREFLVEWRRVSKAPEALFFVQFEKGDSYFHLHILVETVGVKSMVVGRYVSQIKEKLVTRIYRGVEPQLPNWFAVTKTRNGAGGGNKVVDDCYIPNYLLPKTQPELQWAWTNMDQYLSACLNLAERKRLVAQHLTHVSQTQEQNKENQNPNSDAPVIRSKTSARYMELVGWLVDRGITSEKQWIQEDQASYISFNAASNSRSQIKAALDNASKFMSLTKTAPDYLVGNNPPEDITSNRIYKILEMNGYDPQYAASVFLGWAQKKFGKRNTIWLFGPATTGKTNIAEAIAHAVPFYGCVNWTNENFPFNDCVDKMVIWWEEGKMTAKVVESAKAILGGSKVRVDQKCKSSAQIDPTPVIVTSNTNMCAVIDGNSTTFEHQQPLQDRMFKFELTKRLEHDFGKVTKQEVKDFFRWASDHVTEVSHEFYVRKGGARKRPAPNDADISEPKRACPSVAQPSTSDAEAPVDYADRYQNKCSRHVGMNLMLFPCRQCERMNQNVDICFTHGVMDCAECFPVSESQPVSVVRKRTYQKLCPIHHIMGRAPEVACSACDLANVDLDDCDMEQ
uniref:Nonstructural protein n=1 Tax=Adeno-associated virus 13 TaxID=501327 RepID=B5SUY6_9VIRU|nr:nonstructural protein [Adeno-associated virus 13]